MDKNKLIVIGAGPSGLMAAGQAASRGLDVTVLEKMPVPARKLGITGKGRCNLTNTADLRDFISRFGRGSNFVRFALGKFSNHDLIDFFQSLGVQTVAERGGRVFPADQKAGTIVRSLVDWTRKQGAIILTSISAKNILAENNKVTGVLVERTSQAPGEEPQSSIFPAGMVIIASGGASYPATGSTGDGYALAMSLGHTIVPVTPALVPLETSGNIAAKMQDLSLRNVRADLFVHGKKTTHGFGEMLFTSYGVSGPIILTMSSTAVEALNLGREVFLSIDLKPAVTHARLKQRIARVMHEQGKKKMVNILKDFLPLKMIPVFLRESGISPDIQGNTVSADQQQKLRLWCKELKLKIKGYRSFDEAIITSGGVKLSEVDPGTMASRIVKGLYFAGEVLDLDADTGGYNLQAAFSTGWVAGNSAALCI